jgi:hypothetical protein
MEDCRSRLSSSGCPGFGISRVRNLVGEFGMSGKDLAMRIKSRGSVTNRMLRATTRFSVYDESYVAVASTLTSLLTELIGLFADFVESDSTYTGRARSLLQPRFRPAEDSFASLVQVQCTPFSYHDYVETGKGEGSPGFRASGLRNLSLAAGSADDGYRWSSQWNLPEGQWNMSRDLEETTFKCMDIVTGDANSQPSLGALFMLPFARNTTRGLAQDSLILPCVIDSRWAKVDVSYDPVVDKLVFHLHAAAQQLRGRQERLPRKGRTRPRRIGPQLLKSTRSVGWVTINLWKWQ